MMIAAHCSALTAMSYRPGTVRRPGDSGYSRRQTERKGDSQASKSLPYMARGEWR